MRLAFVTLLVALGAVAVRPSQKAVIITYPENTPAHEVDNAIKVLEKAGGIVTHEYKLIKGFAAKASVEALDTIRMLGGEYVPFIEEDSIVSIDGSVSDNGKST